MLINLIKYCIIMTLFFGCATQQKESVSNTKSNTNESSNVEENLIISDNNQANQFSEQQLNFEIKKMLAEINYLKEQVVELDVKSSLYADPFSVYNKEIILNNGSSIFCKIISQDENEIFDTNIVKVDIDQTLKNDQFLEVKDFFRTKKDLPNKKIYHHLGVYIFTRDALTRYVKLKRSKLEIERNLEQMRVMENNMIIKVGLTNSMPLSVDTEDDLIKIKKEMEN